MRLFTAIVLWMLWAGSVQGQTQLNVTGKVLDETGQLLPGVNIIIKGTTNGVTTNASGEFTIAAPSDAVLLFSFIGYTSQEIKVDNQTALSVVMAPDVQSLNEVVIVGYTTQSKATLTSAVEKVDTREMRYAPNVNPVQSLQGRSPAFLFRYCRVSRVPTPRSLFAAEPVPIRMGRAPAEEGTTR
jgi:hypothetical protein